MRSDKTRIYSTLRLNSPPRIGGRLLIVAAIALLAVAALAVYLFAPSPLSPKKQTAEATSAPLTEFNRKEETAIKEMLVEYVHAMLLEGSDNHKNLFTSAFNKNNAVDQAIVPKATSVQIGQPTISLVSPTDARMRFTQAIRTTGGSHHSQERLILKLTSSGWRIDKRASQPIMVTESQEEKLTPGTGSFLYIKSDGEKQRDTDRIKELIQFWADARAEADLEGVVTTYRQDIWERRGTTKEQWLEEFRDPKQITITNVNIVFPSQNLAEVTLNERIEDDTKQAYFDIHLVLQLSDEGWIIADEDSQTVSEQIIQPLVTPQPPVSVVKAGPIAEPVPIPRSRQVAAAPALAAANPAAPELAVAEPAAAVAEPPPAKPEKVTSTAGPPSKAPDLIAGLVLQWKQAWSDKDVDAYLDFYSQNFKPRSGMSIEKWRRYRRTRLGKPKSIDIQISDIQVYEQTETSASVSFIQRYTSNLYQDVTRKTLSLVREGESWKIVAENAASL